MSDDLTIRFFTPAQANEALETVRPLLLEFQAGIAEFQALHADFSAYIQRLARLGFEVEWFSKEADALRIQDSQIALGQTIRAMGIELKDGSRGLIDFPALRNGEPVYLCYHLGESEITHWHPLTTGIGGRRPIDEGFD